MMQVAMLAPLFLFVTSVCSSGEIVLPSKVLERDRPVIATYRTNQLATGRGQMYWGARSRSERFPWN